MEYIQISDANEQGKTNNVRILDQTQSILNITRIILIITIITIIIIIIIIAILVVVVVVVLIIIKKKRKKLMRTLRWKINVKIKQ